MCGNLLLTAGEDAKLRVFSGESSDTLRTLRGHKAAINAG